jgi:hypothetical protein
MKKVLLREILIFGGLAVILALLMHPDLLSNPLHRFTSIIERGTVFHPLFYTFLVYTIISILRLSFTLLKRLFSSSRKTTSV